MSKILPINLNKHILWKTLNPKELFPPSVVLWGKKFLTKPNRNSLALPNLIIYILTAKTAHLHSYLKDRKEFIILY